MFPIEDIPPLELSNDSISEDLQPVRQNGNLSLRWTLGPAREVQIIVAAHLLVSLCQEENLSIRSTLSATFHEFSSDPIVQQLQSYIQEVGFEHIQQNPPREDQWNEYTELMLGGRRKLNGSQTSLFIRRLIFRKD